MTSEGAALLKPQQRGGERCQEIRMLGGTGDNLGLGGDKGPPLVARPEEAPKNEKKQRDLQQEGKGDPVEKNDPNS